MEANVVGRAENESFIRKVAMTEESSNQLRCKDLVLYELDGKAVAIGAYDSFIWKIRSGFAIATYGGLSLLLGFSPHNIQLSEIPVLTKCAVLIGFTFCAALLDFLFLRSKTRVVEARDRLMELAFVNAGVEDWSTSDPTVLELLQNTGESRGRTNWKRYNSWLVIPAIYGTTILIVVFALVHGRSERRPSSETTIKEKTVRIVKKSDLGEPITTDTGEQIFEMIGSPPKLGGANRLSVAKVTLPPGASVARHHHEESDEAYYITAGEARMIVEGMSFTLSAGEACLIKAGQVHQIEVNDSNVDVEFVAISAPPFNADDHHFDP